MRVVQVMQALSSSASELLQIPNFTEEEARHCVKSTTSKRQFTLLEYAAMPRDKLKVRGDAALEAVLVVAVVVTGEGVCETCSWPLALLAVCGWVWLCVTVCCCRGGVSGCVFVCGCVCVRVCGERGSALPQPNQHGCVAFGFNPPPPPPCHPVLLAP
jgi:hypothetical protein